MRLGTTERAQPAAAKNDGGGLLPGSDCLRQNEQQERKRMGSRVAATVCVTALIVAAATPAQAELDFSVEAGVGHSDNISRVPTGEIDETIATAGVDLTWDVSRPRLEGEATVDLNYFDYLDDTYSSEVVGTANGAVVLGLVPDRFTWLVQDSFGQARSDPFTPVTPGSRENINYFTTGPDVIVALGNTGRLRLFGRYSSSEYERSLLDSERLSGGVAVARRLSARSEVAFNAVTERVEFKDDFNIDQDRDNLFVSYTLDGSRTNMQIEAGYTWLELEDGEEDDGALLRVSLGRELSASSNVWLTFGTQLTDAAEALRASVSGPTAVGGAADVTATADPFERRSVAAGWDFSRNRTSIDVGVEWDEDRYETQSALDRTALAWNASIQRNISPLLTVGLLTSLTDEEFDTINQSADELRYGATLDWRFARRVGLRLLAERYDRDSSDPLGEYVENRIFLTLFYRPNRPDRPSP